MMASLILEGAVRKSRFDAEKVVEILRWSLLAVAVGVHLVGNARAQEAPAGEPKAPQAREVRIPVAGAGAFGGDVEMLAKVYVPEGAGPFPVIVYSHGRAGSDADRRKLREPVPMGHVRYWQRKGFAVVAPIRPGYGETGGVDRENNGVVRDAFGNCRSRPDFEATAKGSSGAVLAALDWARGQSWAAKDRSVLVGTSVGGLASVATAATSPPGVVAYINFAGGSGGNPELSPGRSCGVAEMQDLMAGFGRTTKIPNLWLYAENDLYWGAEAPRRWHAAFAAGGSPTQFVQTPAVPEHDGHQLLLRGGRLWGPHVDAFVRTLGF